MEGKGGSGAGGRRRKDRSGRAGAGPAAEAAAVLGTLQHRRGAGGRRVPAEPAGCSARCRGTRGKGGCFFHLFSCRVRQMLVGDLFS